jgi:hypothetical protein
VELVAVLAAILLAGAAALAQILDYGVFELRIRALNSDTHSSVFGGVSLLATAAAVAAAVALAVRMRDLERIALVGALLVILALRVSHPTHVIVVSLPATATALVVLCRQPLSSRSRIMHVGCALLMLSFVIHAAAIVPSSPVAFARDSWSYQLEGVIKHDAELTGWILIAAGLLSVRRSMTAQPSTDRPPALQAA